MSSQVEATADAMIAKLQAELPARIDAINGEIDDQWSIPYPEGVSFGSRAETPYPWVIVLPEETENLVDASGRIHYRHRITAVSWLANSDEEGLVRQLVRYQRAVREVLLRGRMPGRELGDGGYGLTFQRDLYGPVFPGTNAFISWARTTFQIRQQADIG